MAAPRRIAAANLADRSVPFYYQIANLLRRRMEEGELAPGSKLPNEFDLARTFGVSRVPVRQALSLLVAEGFLYRDRGRGTFVADPIPRTRSLKLTGLTEDFVAQGLQAVARVLSVEEAPAPQQAAQFLGLAEGERVVQIRRLRIVDRSPFSLVTNYLPVEVGRRIAPGDLRRLPMLTILEERLGIPLGAIHQTIEAKVADSEVASLLSVDITAPVMYVETYLHTAKGEPLELSRTFYRGDRYMYTVALRKAPGRGGFVARGAPRRAARGGRP